MKQADQMNMHELIQLATKALEAKSEFPISVIMTALETHLMNREQFLLKSINDRLYQAGKTV